jgi:hypothetical protein
MHIQEPSNPYVASFIVSTSATLLVVASLAIFSSAVLLLAASLSTTTFSVAVFLVAAVCVPSSLS